MADHIHDVIVGPLTFDYFRQRIAKGWTVVAVEWRKPSAADELLMEEMDSQEPPYGQRISQDCGHLVEDKLETEALLFIYERVVSGWRPTQIAVELNKSGYRTRRRLPWTPAAVFDLLPRLIELSPKLQGRPDWPSRRAKLTVIA